MPLSSSITAQKEILIPEDYAYSDFTRTKSDATAPSKLSSLNSINAALIAGIGLNYAFDFRFSGFFETYYTLPFSSVISDGKWRIPQLSFQLGVKYRVF